MELVFEVVLDGEVLARLPHLADALKLRRKHPGSVIRREWVAASKVAP